MQMGTVVWLCDSRFQFQSLSNNSNTDDKLIFPTYERVYSAEC